MMTQGTTRRIAGSMFPAFTGAALTLLLLGAIHLWAVRGNAILLDLTFIGCF
ncbi:hypothetical protein [Denitrobaculum tricleocarpae]|uniref:hypothetical protein n=1 Tax=Denitrobaculum tricleocarpae TaxID=2591009 RepID=UPI0015D36ED1|nr:hypothetical protein [Denitrobaculum tricleocarpae]